MSRVPTPKGLCPQPRKGLRWPRMGTGWHRIRRFLRDPDTLLPAEATRRMRALTYLVRLGMRIIRQWVTDRCPQQAAALAYQTSLSLVPLIAIGFALIRVGGSTETEDKLLEFFTTKLLPNLAEVTTFLQSFSRNISVGAAGMTGLLITLVTCYSLYASVEKVFNDVWRVGQRRSLINKFLTFYALVTLLPALFAASLYWSGRLIGTGATQFLPPC